MATKVITIHVCDVCGVETDKSGTFKISGPIGRRSFDFCEDHLEEYMYSLFNIGKRGRKFGRAGEREETSREVAPEPVEAAPKAAKGKRGKEAEATDESQVPVAV